MGWQALEDHARRRRQGTPTLSVLAATLDAARRLWDAWTSGRPAATVAGENPRELVSGWLSGLTADGWRTRAAARLGSTGAVARVLAGPDCAERRLLLDRLCGAEADAALAAACRALIEGPGTGGPARELVTRASAWDWIDERLAGREPDGPWYRVVRPLARVGGDGAPALLVVPSRGRLGTAIELAGQLLVRASTLTVAVVAEATDLERWLAEGPETRWKALAREGTIAVAAGVRTRTQPIAVMAPVSRARSAAEQFLHDRLEEADETRGLFRLNDLVDGMEVDLVCRERRVAIEIDGYHHFTDAAAYRRDRQKDLALQRRGYLVLRFLADDVSARLEEILREVARSVADRRGEE